ncbi:hypothetical protein AVEN_118757-1 [Araneus ventricosus]|uniref:Uncharacterized protein n=1 Tax=Araneus ventricosus TaxID=182803 RepID=A0A4Y2BYJ8_ARAVE|nr:hypothetical protein AVEN_118757-1 [Araneus ventricosus]
MKTSSVVCGLCLPPVAMVTACLGPSSRLASYGAPIQTFVSAVFVCLGLDPPFFPLVFTSLHHVQWPENFRAAVDALTIPPATT